MDIMECPVCLMTYRDPVLLPSCGHTFCSQCVNGLHQCVCPTCRAAFQRGEPRPNFALRQVLADGVCLAASAPVAAPAQALRQLPGAEMVGGLQRSLTHDLDSSCAAQRNEAATDVDQIRRLQSLGVPYGLSKLLIEEDKQIGLRIFLLDNSGSTATYDGHIFEELPGGVLVSRPCTRWEEITNMAMEQARWNATVGTPCEFVLLNPGPGRAQEGRDFVRMGRGEHSAVAALQKMLDATSPRGVTPLADRLSEIYVRVKQENVQLAERGQRVVLVIATDGVPTSANNSQGTDFDKRQVVQILQRLGLELSVFLVIRLTTDDDDIVQYYNEVDEQLELPLEVLDDIASEAKEIYDHGNGWLTYSPLLHRIREGGTFVKLFDLLDERQLTPTEVTVLAQLLLCGERAALSRTTEDFPESLRAAVAAAPKVYDPLRKRMLPPIDVSKALRVVVPLRVRISQFFKGGLRRACSACSR